MIKKIGLILVIVLVVFFVFRDLIIKQVIVSVGSSVVGAPIKVGGFSLSLLTSQVHLTDVKLYNPPGFTNNSLIDISHVYVHYYPMAFMSGKMSFSLIDLDVRQLAIERNKQGQYNVSALKVAPQKTSGTTAKGSGPSKPLDMRIDVLKLNVDRVTYRDETKDGQIKETNHGVGLHKKEFRNITSAQQLAALVLFESSGLGQLKDIAMLTTQGLVKDVNSIVTKNLGVDAEKTVSSLLGSFKSAVSK